MAAQDNQISSVDTIIEPEIMSSKFKRKTKLRRKSIPDPVLTEDSFKSPPIQPPPDLPDISTSSMGEPSVIPEGELSAQASALNKIEIIAESLPRPSTASTDTTESSVHTSPPRQSPANSISSSRPTSPRSQQDTVVMTTPDPASEPETLDPVATSPLSQEELEQAKTIVLDLLGWGVGPEYLLTSGLSPVTIFRVFTELNLQLPTNLEVSDELRTAAYPRGFPLPIVNNRNSTASVLS